MERKTKVGRLLQKIGDAGKPILNILSKVPIPGADLLGEVADAIKTSGDIRAEDKEELLHAISMDLQDLANARQSNTEIQQSQFSSWMAKNVPYLMDIFVLLVWGIFTFYIAATIINVITPEEVEMTAIMGIYAAVTGMATQIIVFHRGSTMGSRMKDIFKN